jgi:shikimate dehydrogenase
MAIYQSISGSAKVAGVMGFPVSHSLSPRLHNHWLSRYGVDGVYIPMSVAPEQLERALRALPALGFRGCNLTLPLKEIAFAVVDSVDPVAEAIGAINTIVVGEDGRLHGSNTDAYGFITNLKSTAGDLEKHLPHAVVLGAGGAAKAVVKALLDEGSTRITLTNRTRAKADALAERFGKTVSVAEYSSLNKLLPDCTLLVNTTSLGMQGQAPLSIDLTTLSTAALVTDIVYNPLETELLKSARARGNATVDGLGMLLHQAVVGFDAWFGVTPEVDEDARKALLSV